MIPRKADEPFCIFVSEEGNGGEGEQQSISLRDKRKSS